MNIYINSRCEAPVKFHTAESGRSVLKAGCEFETVEFKPNRFAHA